MDRANPRAGEHGVSRFWNHGKVDRHAITLFDPARLQHVGEAADLLGKLSIGDVFGFRRIVALPDDRRLVGSLGQMPVDAVHRDIGDAIFEPFDRDMVRIEGHVPNFAERLHPLNALAVFRPEAFGVSHRACIHLLIAGVVDIGALGPLGRYVIEFVGHMASPRRRAVSPARSFPQLYASTPRPAPSGSQSRFGRRPLAGQGSATSPRSIPLREPADRVLRSCA